MKKEVAVISLLALCIILSSCSSKNEEEKFLCPKTSEIGYDAATSTYYIPVDCVPSEPGCGATDEYMQWAAENCPYRLEERQV
jgi:hypothetical protein